MSQIDNNIKMFDNMNDYVVIDRRRIYVGNGGSGSGNFGHAGRPGEIGGSGGGGGGGGGGRQESSKSIGTRYWKAISITEKNIKAVRTPNLKKYKNILKKAINAEIGDGKRNTYGARSMERALKEINDEIKYRNKVSG